MTRQWTRVKSAFTEVKTSKMIEDVQRARTTLLDARMMQLHADTSKNFRQQAGLSNLALSRLENLSTGVKSVSISTSQHTLLADETRQAATKTSNTVERQLLPVIHSMQRQLQDSEARIATVSEDIQHLRAGQETNSAILSSTFNVTRANIDQMESAMGTLPQLLIDMKGVKSSVHKVLQHQRTSETLVDAAFEKAVSIAVTNALSQPALDSPMDRGLSTSRVEPGHNGVRMKLLYSYSKAYWFGYLSAMSTRTATGTDDHGNLSFTISTDVIFTPARWVSRWIARLELLKCLFSTRLNTWVIRTSKVLKDEDASLLAKLLLHGTSEQFQSVVRKRDIRPNDLILSNDDGISLLQVCVDWLSIVGLDSDEFIDDKASEFVHEQFSPFGSLERAKYAIKCDIIPHRAEVVKRIGETCSWLLDYDTCGAISW
ncbi:MAG: hypothetical protein Q9157_006305 [Trypethelium eluteriae]